MLCVLGAWQLQRRAWKLDLIQRVETRIHASPLALPSRERWPHITAPGDEYRHVEAKGVFLPVRPALVQAVTERGGGFWVLAPLRTDGGAVVLVNRGFVPSDRRATTLAAPAPSGPADVTGLLRLTEPGGAFLRKNNPAEDRWYSRDVDAITAARGLTDVAPFFIDADKGSDTPDDAPAGGLTVVRFPNNHLVYAITWFAMAALLAGATVQTNLRVWHSRSSSRLDP